MNSLIFDNRQTKLTLSIECALLYLLFLFLPYYGFRSGGFQFVDIIIATLVILEIYTGSFFLFFQRANMFRPRVVLLLLWGVYTFINLLAHYFFSVGVPIKLHVYPLYGFIIMVIFYGIGENIWQKHGAHIWYETLINALLLSFIMPIANLIFVAPRYYRYELSFDNPNQIVFFVLMQFAILFYLLQIMRGASLPIKKIKTFIIIQLNLILLIVSASRCGLFLLPLYFTLLFVLLYDKKIHLMKWMFYIIFTVLLSLLLYFFVGKYNTYCGVGGVGLARVFGDIKIRIWDNLIVFGSGLKTIFFGIGLGKTEIELHNNFLAMLQQSGVISLILYLLLHGFVLYDLVKKKWIYSLPFVTYILVSMFHFTQRSRFIWIYFAFTFLILTIGEKGYISKMVDSIKMKLR